MSFELIPSSRSALPFALAGILRVLATTVRALRHRRDIHLLLEMDDRCLKDLGLVRSDVTGALAQSLGRDPSTILLVRSIERRSRSPVPNATTRSRERLV